MAVVMGREDSCFWEAGRESRGGDESYLRSREDPVLQIHHESKAEDGTL